MDTGFYPEDSRFYYKKRVGNKIYYKLLANDKLIARSKIPKSIVDDIKNIDDIPFDNSCRIGLLNDDIKRYNDIINKYMRYINKLNDDISHMEVFDIPADDPRNYYYKRKLGNIKPAIYSYSGYVSSEDMICKKDLLGDLVKGKYLNGKSKRVYIDDDIIERVEAFDPSLTFISKMAEIEISKKTILIIEEKIYKAKDEIRSLEVKSGKLDKVKLINEYYRLKAIYEKEIKKDVEDRLGDLRSKYKYSSFEYHSEERMRMEAEYKQRVEREREEMIRKKLEEERAKRDREKAEEKIKLERKYIDDPRGFLSSLGIIDKITWKKWLVSNHPDKRGASNNDICMRVISAGRAIGY